MSGGRSCAHRTRTAAPEPEPEYTTVRNRQTHRFGRACFHFFLLGCLVNLTAGCFVPQPIEHVPEPSTEVQIELNEQAKARLSYQARLPVNSVTGRVLQASRDSIILAVRWGEVAGGSYGRPGPDVVRLSQLDIARISQPRFDLGRTVLFTGIMTAVAVVVVGGILGSGVGGIGNDGDLGNDDDNDPNNN